MVRKLGFDVSTGVVRVVALDRKGVVWAAECRYDGPESLQSALASLVSERPAGRWRANVALSGDVAQCKLIYGLSSMPAADLRRHVALEYRRYFLTDGEPLVTDAAWMTREAGASSVLAAAPASLVEAIHQGLGDAGIEIVAVSPAMCCEASLQDVAMLTASLAETGASYAIAVLAALSRRPGIQFIAPHRAAESERRQKTNAIRRIALALVALLAAAAIREVRLALFVRDASVELARLRGSVERVTALRANLDSVAQAIEVLEGVLAPTSHGKTLELIATTLPDSAFVTGMQLAGDGSVRLVIQARRVSEAIRALRRRHAFRNLGVDGAITRERLSDGDWERATASSAPGT